MSRSGVAVNDECVKAFNDLKLGKSHKYIVYKLSDDKSEVVIDKTSPEGDYEQFVNELPENDCRYAVFDFEYELASGEGKRTKLVFYIWSPDTAPIKSKMVYASSKEAIRRALNGISTEIQGTDFSEVSYSTVLEKVSRSAGSH